MTDEVEHNRIAWNAESRSGDSHWCEPFGKNRIAEAREGKWSVALTAHAAVPRDWFGDVKGKHTLCLGSGGGQQAPLLAAAGAIVTSFDLSEEQLEKDAMVAKREQLNIRLAKGDMADLSCFANESFDVVFHPVSNVFVADVHAVWRECHRVLRPSGRLLSGFMNPDFYRFDHDALEQGQPMVVSYRLPYSDTHSLTPDRLQKKLRRREPLEFSHSLTAQIGGQTAAGFLIAGLYEDHWDDEATRLNPYMPTSIATLGLKLKL